MRFGKLPGQPNLAAKFGSSELVKASRRNKPRPKAAKPAKAAPKKAAVRPARKPKAEKAAPKKAAPKRAAARKASVAKAPKATKATKRAPKKTAAAKPASRGWLGGLVRLRKKPIFEDKPGFQDRVDTLDALPSPIRIRIVLGLLGVFALAIGIRAGQLQLVMGDHYRELAIGQGSQRRSIEGRRGRILDRSGAELANTVDAESVFAQRGDVKDPARVARTLGPILELSVPGLEKRLRAGKSFTYLRRRVSPAISEAVRAAEVEGIGTQIEPRRIYGNVRLAAHVLGFVDIDGRGRAGVESSQQTRLDGQSASVLSLGDAKGMAVWTEGFDAPVTAGQDVVLTLDRHIQYRAEEVLEAAVKSQGAKAGGVVVLDAKTSEILALASYPSYNPNNLSLGSVSDRKNRVTQTLVDPGSTAKIVTISAALESGAVRPETLVDCEQGQWRVGNRTIRDANHRFGLLTVSDVMKKSSNIGAGKIALKMGKSTLHDYLVRFGFGRETGVELPGEVGGILRPVHKWREVDTVNIAFGQGISVTPLQVAQAANVIAAKGVLRPPRVVRGVMSDARKLELDPVPEGTRVLSEATARTVAEMMTEVTADGGTAPKARVPGFTVAGKTGTSQKYDPAIGAYSRERYVASFVGFLPAEDPEVTILVVIDEPKESIYGGQVAGPAFRDIAVAALASRDLYPDVPPEPLVAESRPMGSGASTVRTESAADAHGTSLEAVRALEAARSEAPPSASAVAAPGVDQDPFAVGLSPAARALLGEPLPAASEPEVHGRPKDPGAMP